jgi:hypothetical protein
VSEGRQPHGLQLLPHEALQLTAAVDDDCFPMSGMMSSTLSPLRGSADARGCAARGEGCVDAAAVVEAVHELTLLLSKALMAARAALWN